MPSVNLAAGALAALASGVIWGSLLAVVGEAVLWAARRPTAATRYLVRFVALLAVAGVVAVSVARELRSPASVASAAVAPAAAPAAPAAPAEWAIELPAGEWATALLLALSLIALARSAQVAVKLRAVGRLKRESRVFELEADPAAGARGSLRRTATVAAPVAVGYVRPAILLPDELIRRLTETELRQVVAHERAHLARFDDWTALAQRVIEAALFFHPAVHFLGRRLDLDREIACDDRVVETLSGERGYARFLARLAEATITGTGSLSAGVTPRTSHLESRIRALLDPRPASSGVSVVWGAWAMVALAAAGAVVPSTIPGFVVVPEFVSAPQLVAGEPAEAPSREPISLASASAATAAAPAAVPARTAASSTDFAPPATLAAVAETGAVAAREPELAVTCGAACAPRAEPKIVGSVRVPMRVARLEGKRREPVISGPPATRRGLGLSAGAPVTVIPVGGPTDGLNLRAVGGALRRPMVGQFRHW